MVTESSGLEKVDEFATCDPTPPRAWLTYTPLHANGTAAAEEDAGQLSDLLACPDSRALFTRLEAHVEIEQRSSRSAKQFFCPCCPKSALKIGSEEGGEEVMRCPACGWDARSTGVTTVSELLARDADPYPWVTEELRTLIARGETKEEGGSGGGGEERARGELTATSTGRGTRPGVVAMARRAKKDDELSKAESASLCAQNFTREQEDKERRVFSSWQAGAVAVPISEAAGRGRPSGDISRLMGEIKVEDMAGVERRVCGRTWYKSECASRRRVPAARVRVCSPFGTRRDAVPAEQVIPELVVWMHDACSAGDAGREAGLLVVQVSNKNVNKNQTTNGDVEVTISNADDATQRAAGRLGRGTASVELRMAACSWRTKAATTFRETGAVCPRLAALDVSVRAGKVADANAGNATIERGRQHEWRVRVYARHSGQVHVRKLG